MGHVARIQPPAQLRRHLQPGTSHLIRGARGPLVQRNDRTSNNKLSFRSGLSRRRIHLHELDQNQLHWLEVQARARTFTISIFFFFDHTILGLQSQTLSWLKVQSCEAFRVGKVLLLIYVAQQAQGLGCIHNIRSICRQCRFCSPPLGVGRA